MNSVPEITGSTEEERRAYIKNRFPCIADCDMCGLCKVFHGKDPEGVRHQQDAGRKWDGVYQSDEGVRHR